MITNISIIYFIQNYFLLTYSLQKNFYFPSLLIFIYKSSACTLTKLKIKKKFI